MNIKRNIIFSLESRKKDGKPILKNVPIRMRVIYDSKRIEFTTGYRIDASKWDNNKQKVKKMVRRSIVTSALFIFPMLFGLAAVADSLVEILLTTTLYFLHMDIRNRKLCNQHTNNTDNNQCNNYSNQ